MTFILAIHEKVNRWNFFFTFQNYGFIVLDNFLVVEHSSADKTSLSRVLRNQFTMSTRQEYALPPRPQMQLPTQTVLSRARAQPCCVRNVYVSMYV